MLEEKTIPLTKEELCRAAHGNLVALILVANQFMKEQSLKADDFWNFVGRKFARGWVEIDRGDLPEIALRITRNMASCGAELQTFLGNDQEAQLKFTGWPPEWAVNFWESSPQEAARMCEVFRPITKSLGYAYDWKLEDDVLTMNIKRL